uniref:Small integral membrane protein 32 n=1 Tax=Gopherus agassizii TaxID=38772 RepID=A0A452GWZ6_9SAUR
MAVTSFGAHTLSGYNGSHHRFGLPSTATHAALCPPASVESKHSSAFYMSTARVLKEGEINKPDLVTYIVLFFFLLLTVIIIVLFINCQLKNSFFATLPYDRSLRETRSTWRTQAV